MAPQIDITHPTPNQVSDYAREVFGGMGKGRTFDQAIDDVTATHNKQQAESGSALKQSFEALIQSHPSSGLLKIAAAERQRIADGKGPKDDGFSEQVWNSVAGGIPLGRAIHNAEAAATTESNGHKFGQWMHDQDDLFQHTAPAAPENEHSHYQVTAIPLPKEATRLPHRQELAASGSTENPASAAAPEANNQTPPAVKTQIVMDLGARARRPVSPGSSL